MDGRVEGRSSEPVPSARLGAWVGGSSGAAAPPSPLLHDGGGQDHGKAHQEEDQRHGGGPVREPHLLGEEIHRLHHAPGGGEEDAQHLPDGPAVELAHEALEGIHGQAREGGMAPPLCDAAGRPDKSGESPATPPGRAGSSAARPATPDSLHLPRRRRRGDGRVGTRPERGGTARRPPV